MALYRTREREKFPLEKNAASKRPVRGLSFLFMRIEGKAHEALFKRKVGGLTGKGYACMNTNLVFVKHSTLKSFHCIAHRNNACNSKATKPQRLPYNSCYSLSYLKKVAVPHVGPPVAYPCQLQL